MNKGIERIAYNWVIDNFPEASPQEAMRLFSAYTAGYNFIDKPKKSTYEIIIQVVCDYFFLPEARIFSKTRKREIVFARQTSMYFAKQYKVGTSREIAEIFGLDHATALHAITTIYNLTDTNSKIRLDIQAIQKVLDKKIIVKGDII